MSLEVVLSMKWSRDSNVVYATRDSLGTKKTSKVNKNRISLFSFSLHRMRVKRERRKREFIISLYTVYITPPIGRYKKCLSRQGGVILHIINYNIKRKIIRKHIFSVPIEKLLFTCYDRHVGLKWLTKWQPSCFNPHPTQKSRIRTQQVLIT